MRRDDFETCSTREVQRRSDDPLAAVQVEIDPPARGIGDGDEVIDHVSAVTQLRMDAAIARERSREMAAGKVERGGTDEAHDRDRGDTRRGEEDAAVWIFRC